MKGIKKLLTGILAATMIMGASMTAFAADQTTVTIVRDDSYHDQKDTTAQKYTYYKVLSANVNNQGKTAEDGIQTGVKAIYYVDSDDKKKALSGLFEFSSPVSEDGQTHYYVTGVKKEEGMSDQAFAAAIADVVKKNSAYFVASEEISVSTEENKSNTVFTMPADGYYLVESELGTQYILETWGQDSIIVKEKNQYPSIDKTQMDGVKTTAYQDNVINVMVGDTIYYSVVVYVPATTSEDIIVTDTMSVGLTPADVSTITASAYDADPKVNYTIDANSNGNVLSNDDWTREKGENGVNYKMTIKPTEKTLDKFIQFKFTATVNDGAITTEDINKKNDVTLKYGNYYQYDTVKHQIYKTGLIKYDGATADVDENTKELTAKIGREIKYLEGAEFALYAGTTTPIPVVPVKDNDTVLYYRPALEGENGEPIVSVNSANAVVIRGLDKDVQYTLKETKAPTNYNPLSDDKNSFTLAVEEDNDVNDATVANLSICYIANLQGAILPSTGGIGTTIFYIVGGMLIIAGVAYFILRRKTSVE